VTILGSVVMKAMVPEESALTVVAAAPAPAAAVFAFGRECPEKRSCADLDDEHRIEGRVLGAIPVRISSEPRRSADRKRFVAS
jgi:hypothetical protein